MPVVLPSNTPDRILTLSGSRRCVVKRDWPGLRLSSQGWMSASLSGMRGGTPSTTQPIAGPWLSPQVVKRNSVPKLLPDIGRQPFGLKVASISATGRRRVDGQHADDVVAAVDVVDLAGDAGAEVAQQIEARRRRPPRS